MLLASVVLFGGTTWCEWSGHRWWYSLRRAAPSPEVVDAVKAAERQRLARVVLLTLDGPVTEDVLSPALMPRLHAAVAKEGVWLEARAASVTTLSLPSYQALSVGRLTACRTNDCGRVTEETVGEFLVRALKVPREQVALFASWSRTSLAVASREDVMFLDAPEEGGKADGRPWRNARLDVETFARARAHWAEVHPRFLHLSLLDTEVFVEFTRTAQEHDASPWLGDIHVPTLVVAGERDLFTPRHLSLEMAQRVSDAELLEIPRGSHAALIEQPELINLRLEKFLRERIVPFEASTPAPVAPLSSVAPPPSVPPGRSSVPTAADPEAATNGATLPSEATTDAHAPARVATPPLHPRGVLST